MAVRSNRWMLTLGVPILAARHAGAEDSVGFSHETYSEDHGRMQVQTESLRIEKTFAPWFDLTLRQVFDSISGATPIGAPAINQLNIRDPQSHTRIPPIAITGYTRQLDGVSGASPISRAISKNMVPLANSNDFRLGTDISAAITSGPHRFVPEFSYSSETDYVSYAAALNYSLELNDKNTILNLGWSHAYDFVLANQFTYITHHEVKNTDDFIVGVTQLLGPETIFSANVTIGHEQGYLRDPYRGVVFDESALDPDARVVLGGENRPSTRDSQALNLSVTQAVTPLNGSIEGSYRFYHDSYGIFANTVGVAWFQKIGQSLVLSPSFRYYRQSAASFYAIQFPGDPTVDPARAPRYYSSDYRLSELETFTLGFEASFALREHWDFRLGYQRYWMHGLDHTTLQSTYPNANIFTVGLSYTF